MLHFIGISLAALVSNLPYILGKPLHVSMATESGAPSLAQSVTDALPEHLPIGASPAGRHSVVVSLPTMADVHAYEQGDPTARACIQLGYPRFVRHSLIRMAEDLLFDSCTICRAQAKPNADPMFSCVKNESKAFDATECALSIPAVLAEPLARLSLPVEQPGSSETAGASGSSVQWVCRLLGSEESAEGLIRYVRRSLRADADASAGESSDATTRSSRPGAVLAH